MHLQRFFTDEDNRRLAFAFIILVCVVVIAGVLSFHGANSLVADERAVTHTQQVLAELQGLQTRMDDAETGQRGYIITGDANYLLPYTAAQARTAQQLSDLQQLTADSPIEQDRLAILTRLVARKFAELQKTIDLRKNNQTDQAIALVKTDEGLHTMDAIRATIGEMQMTENALLIQRKANTNANLVETSAATISATLVSVGLLLLVFWLVSREITEREQASNEQKVLLVREKSARATAEEAVIARDQFLSLAAHELKTPLTALMANEQMLVRRIAKEGGLSERNQRSLRLLASQAVRLKDLIDLMLDVSRIENGQLRIDQTPLDLCELTRRIVEETQLTTERHTFTFTGTDETLLVLGDALRMEQVVQNLLQNAIKYSPQGGMIMVQCLAESGQAVIMVHDEGIGIPTEAQEHLFERYYRSANADPAHVSGMGVGLYVAQEIVQRHGGAITVTSAISQGSAFTVRLPLWHAALPAPHVSVGGLNKSHSENDIEQ